MSVLSNFAENLAALMAERNLNAPALAKLLKTDRSNITRYLRGERLPVFDGFIAMLDFFNVSADVLLGLVDYTQDKDFLPLPVFNEQLKEIMKQTNTSQYKLEHQFGISGSSVYNWLNGNSLPNAESLVRLAQCMDVSVDYLLGRVK